MYFVKEVMCRAHNLHDSAQSVVFKIDTWKKRKKSFTLAIRYGFKRYQFNLVLKPSESKGPGPPQPLTQAAYSGKALNKNLSKYKQTCRYYLRFLPFM